MYQLFAFMILCGLSGPVTGSEGDKKPPPSIDLNGTWKTTGLVDAGKKVPAEQVARAANGLIFKDGK